jgi:branched-chain amino acid transport system substrate-binding protein
MRLGSRPAFAKIVSAIVVLVFALSSAGPEAARAQGTPFELNFVISLTGPAAFIGSKEADSFKVLEGLVNATGGIKGRPVKFVVADDQSNPQVAVQLVNALIAKKVSVIVGPIFTASCSATQPIVEKDGPLTYCTSPSIVPHDDTYMFMATPSLDDVEPSLLNYAKSRGWTRLGLMTSIDASGQDFERRFDPILGRPEYRGMQLAAREHFAPTDINVAAQIARIKAAKPDLLMTFCVGPAFGTLLRSMRDVGLDIPVYASGANMTFAQISDYTSFLPSEVFFNAMHGVTLESNAPAGMRRAQRTYFDAMKKAGVRVEAGTTIPWDPGMVVIDALRHLGTDATAQQLRSYVQNLKGWTGIQGTYDFTAYKQRGIGESAVAFFRWDAPKADFVLAFPTARR